MFNVNSKPRFQTTIKLFALADTDGEVPSFKATYLALSDDELKQFDIKDTPSAQEFLRKVLVKLDDLVDDDKKPVAYSEELREELLKQQYMRLVLLSGYSDAIASARLGN